MSQSFDSVRPVAHNDEGFLRPQAWDEAKAAFGQGGDIAEMLTRLEECAIASPRLLLAAAIHAFLQMNDQFRAAALRSYLSSPSVRPDCESAPKGTKGATRHTARPRFRTPSAGGRGKGVKHI